MNTGTRSKARLAALAAMLALASGAVAQPAIKDLDTYAKVTGELIMAKSSCGFDLDQAKMQGLIKSLQPNDMQAVMTAVGAATNAAGTRRQQIGNDAFCRNIIAAYGPAGTTFPGIVTQR